MNEIQVEPRRSFNPAYSPSGGFAYFADNSIKTWIIEPQLNYRKVLGKGQLDILVGTTFQQDMRDRKGFAGSGYTNDALIEDITAASKLVTMDGTLYAQYRYNALFGRVNYTWGEKYILNFTGRRDGSSRYGPGNQFANFGSVGAAWIFSKEKWVIGRWPFLSFGKLRASYGSTGNDQIADYGYIDTYIPGPPYQDTSGLYNNRLFNPNYSWEKNVKFEAGLELGFVQDRILLRTTYYNNRSSNQLVKYSLSGVTGFTSIRANIPAIVGNTGIEIELNTVNLRNRHFAWTTYFNLTIPRNKLLAFPGLESSSYNYYYAIGKPLSLYKGFRYLGVDQQKGVYTIDDVDKDGKLTNKDLAVMKNIGARLYGGWQSSLQYKNWQLDVLFQFVQQNGYQSLYMNRPGSPYENMPIAVLDRWQKTGDKTDIQRFTQDLSSEAGIAAAYMAGTDKNIVDASFIRLKSLSLSYKLPAKWGQRLHLEGSQVYIQGQNLLTITDYPGREPENSILFQSDIDGYPPLRVWTAGLRLAF
jgi:TonB-linked SusC/RagA family outer membrane protein